jgi:sulfur-carrier protein
VPVRVELPYHLRLLAQLTSREVELEVAAPVTLTAMLDALEARYPMLRGTIRDHGSLERRPFLRFYACEQDLSNHPHDEPLPPEVTAGTEPLLIIGGLAGG